ncbi:MAG: YedE family putative selenium transporter [Coriobacteriia bacterium]|nr:YedE family putative selenium transporter [Coriobacteriia bacterium]
MSAGSNSEDLKSGSDEMLKVDNSNLSGWERKESRLKIFHVLFLSAVGAIVAITALTLTALGNPANMGFCVACFLRDIAGAVGLHSAAMVQYVRPEIIGIVLGAFIFAFVRKEFKPKGGSAPVTRFVLGLAMMMGALIFLGCPLRMLLRISAGDLNAIVGLFGLVAGIFAATLFLKKGFSLKRNYDQGKLEGSLLPIAALILLGIVLFAPVILLFSIEGPGSMHAPLLIALAAGLAIGALGFASRLCFTGGIRDAILMKKIPPMLWAFVALLVVAFVGNLILGTFNLGFADQPIAHTDGLWNFLGMTLVGFSATLLAGCPFRQLVLAGSGNPDSVMAVAGMIAGAALMHNFNMASSPAGIGENAVYGFIVIAVIVVSIAVCNTFFDRAQL